MKLQCLASGSTGNCYILRAGDDKIILDAGVRFSQIQQALNFDYSGVSACLVTHEHMDHAKAVKELAVAGIDVYMSEGTANALGVNSHRIKEIIAGAQDQIGNWVIKAFTTQHDAAEPLGYIIVYAPTTEALVYITDTYYVKQRFSNIDYWLIECNYCTDRLLEQHDSGEVGTSMYHRILQSHMSLEHLKNYFNIVGLGGARKIVLLHLSDARSDEARMVREVGELTGVDTVAAKAGLEIELKQYPF